MTFAVKSNNAVGAVVVTYHPDAGFEQRLAIVRREIARVIIVDNSGPGAAQDRVRAACAAVGCEFVGNTENLGLGAALNTGFSRHLAGGTTWAIAFDQDSTPAADFVRGLLKLPDEEPEPSRIAVVGANWTDEARPGYRSRHLQRRWGIPFFYARRPVGAKPQQVTCVIASGSLFHLPTWSALGGFEEHLFLDLVDSEYCLRAAQAGYVTLVSPHARLLHRRGAKRPVVVLGVTFWPAFMPAARLRLLYRNRVWLIRRHLWHAPHWVAFELVYAFKVLFEILALEEDKAPKLRACLRGIWEGWCGGTGRTY